MLTIITILILAFYIYLGWKRPAAALITSPFVAGVIFLAGISEDDVDVVILSPFIFLATLIAVLMSKQELDREKWPKAFVKYMFISLACIPLIMIMLILGASGGYGTLLFVVCLASIARFGLISRDATALYVVSTIGSSIRQNLPLSMALETASGSMEGKRSRILRNIQKWLVQGYSLSESIKRGYPRCPGYAVAMIAAAERIDQLPKAITAIEADMIAKTNESRRIRPVHPFYPILLLIMMFFLLMGLMTFVIPSFQTALSEITEGGALPKLTQIILGIMTFIMYEYGWIFGIFILITIFIFIPYWIYCKFRPRRPDEPYLSSRIGDFIKWRLPVLHYFERNYSLVQVVELLRLSLNAGSPVNDAITNTLKLDVNNSFKKRLRKWLRRVEEGENISTAARKCKLGAPLAWAFDDKVNQGNTPAILETLESFYRSSYSYSVNLVRCIMWPCVILAMGLIVGFVVLGIFLPGIQIINTLSGSIMP